MTKAKAYVAPALKGTKATPLVSSRNTFSKDPTLGHRWQKDTGRGFKGGSSVGANRVQAANELAAEMGSADKVRRSAGKQQ